MAIPFVDLKAQYQALKPQIDARIQKVLDTGAFINGPEVAELENRLAQFVGCKHALAVANGTDALLIPLMAMGIGPGDEVITTAFSFIATAEVIVLAGATPVYVDIDPKTFNMDMAKLEKAITKKTKAIMPVSLYGQMPDMDAMMAIANKHNIKVIEDAAQSFGAKYKGKRSGSITHATGTSFFPAKPLGCYGDGGAIFTNDADLHKVMKEIREHGSEVRYYHTRIGFNARLDTIQCAILLAKMDRYEWELEQRDRIAKVYTQAFKELEKHGVKTPVVGNDYFSAWAQYTLVIPNRDAFQKKMTEAGVPTSIHYPRIMPDQPAYKHTLQPNVDLSHSRFAADHVISLPMYPDMPESIQKEIISKVLAAF